MSEEEYEFSKEFVAFMKNRMEVSYYKYGYTQDAYPHKVDALKSMEARIREYRETKNTEFLVDAANFLMIEFMFPSIEGAFFKSTDDSSSP